MTFKELLKIKGFTLNKLSSDCGISYSTLHDTIYKKGRIEKCQIDRLLIIAEKLDTTCDVIYNCITNNCDLTKDDLLFSNQYKFTSHDERIDNQNLKQIIFDLIYPLLSIPEQYENCNKEELKISDMLEIRNILKKRFKNMNDIPIEFCYNIFNIEEYEKSNLEEKSISRKAYDNLLELYIFRQKDPQLKPLYNFIDSSFQMVKYNLKECNLNNQIKTKLSIEDIPRKKIDKLRLLAIQEKPNVSVADFLWFKQNYASNLSLDNIFEIWAIGFPNHIKDSERKKFLYFNQLKSNKQLSLYSEFNMPYLPNVPVKRIIKMFKTITKDNNEERIQKILSKSETYIKIITYNPAVTYNNIKDNAINIVNDLRKIANNNNSIPRSFYDDSIEEKIDIYIEAQNAVTVNF